MLLKNVVTPPYAANCVALDNTCYDSIFEICWKKRKSDGNIDIDDVEIPDFLSPDNVRVNILLKDNILYYISGFIERSI